MKRPQPSDGFVLSFVMNLILHFQWGIAAVVLLILCLWLKLPLWIMIAAIAIWVGYSAVSAGILVWGNQCSNAPTGPEKPNLNPYSAKNADYVVNKVQTPQESEMPKTDNEKEIRGLDD